jgi:hypothetical protein
VASAARTIPSAAAAVAAAATLATARVRAGTAHTRYSHLTDCLREIDEDESELAQVVASAKADGRVLPTAYGVVVETEELRQIADEKLRDACDLYRALDATLSKARLPQVTAAEWRLIQAVLPPSGGPGKPRQDDRAFVFAWLTSIDAGLLAPILAPHFRELSEILNECGNARETCGAALGRKGAARARFGDQSLQPAKPTGRLSEPEKPADAEAALAIRPRFGFHHDGGGAGDRADALRVLRHDLRRQRRGQPRLAQLVGIFGKGVITAAVAHGAKGQICR